MQLTEQNAKIFEYPRQTMPEFVLLQFMSSFFLMCQSIVNTESDPAWLARFHAGDGDVFQQLHQSYGDNLIAFLASRGTEANLCCDLAQKTWVKAFTCRHQFKGGSFRAWLYHSAKNQRIDESRRRRLVEMPEHLDVPDLGANQVASENEQLGALEDCWESLPTELNQTLRMHYFGDLKYQDIAFTLEISAGTVASRIHRAKISLKSCIEGKLV